MFVMPSPYRSDRAKPMRLFSMRSRDVNSST